ncbi:MAG: hypothetical protein EBT20_18230, partial [Alphaproteobacteria bacterium]|nr:hypothetical protein [Alphaproteobacteria bacterium]
ANEGTVDGLVVTGNSATVGSDMIYSANDVSGLVQIVGDVTNVTVEDNDLNWLATDEDISGVTPASAYKATLEGVSLNGGINGTVTVAGNDIDFATDELQEIGIYIAETRGGAAGTYSATTTIANTNNVDFAGGADTQYDVIFDGMAGDKHVTIEELPLDSVTFADII